MDPISKLINGLSESSNSVLACININIIKVLNKRWEEALTEQYTDDGKNIFHWENISVDSAKINWDKMKKERKRIKHFYVELGDVKDMSIR